jgi:hypothetical protein
MSSSQADFMAYLILARDSTPGSSGTGSKRLDWTWPTTARTVQLLLGHSKLESTVRYPGIEVDDALQIPPSGQRFDTVAGPPPRRP